MSSPIRRRETGMRRGWQLWRPASRVAELGVVAPSTHSISRNMSLQHWWRLDLPPSAPDIPIARPTFAWLDGHGKNGA